jgi:hypothetical protein
MPVQNYRVTSGVPMPWAEIVGGGGLDVTGVTYNTNGTVATYTANGRTWTLSYLSDGRPDTETSSGFTRQYTYDASGNFTGVSGAGVATNQTNSGTLANRPSSALAGDRYFCTDVGPHGVMTEYKASGYWGPAGTQLLESLLGTTSSPVSNTLTNANTTSTLFKAPDGTTQLIRTIPANLLTLGKSRLRIHVRPKRTQTSGTNSITVYMKLGTAGTTSDGSISSNSVGATDGISAHLMYDLMLTNLSGKVESYGNLGPNATATTAGEISGTITFTPANAWIISIGITGVNAADTGTTIYLTDVAVEWLA